MKLEEDYIIYITLSGSQRKLGAALSFLGGHSMKKLMIANPKYPWPKGPRTSGCWNCQTFLHSDFDDECSFCHGMVCPCGACGCDSPAWSQDKADRLYEFRKQDYHGKELDKMLDEHDRKKGQG